MPGRADFLVADAVLRNLSPGVAFPANREKNRESYENPAYCDHNGGGNALKLRNILLEYPRQGTGKHSAKNREDFSNEHGRMRAFEPAGIRVLGKCRRHPERLDGLAAVHIAKES